MFPHHQQRLWPYRTVLGNRRNYSGRSYFEDDRPWYQWHHVTEAPLAHPWMIVFPWVSTHNHFAVLRERSAPLNSAPVIRLPETASDSDVLQLDRASEQLTHLFLAQAVQQQQRPATSGPDRNWRAVDPVL